MSRRRRSVAIVGGGPAGLFLARLLGLAARGWDITVVERSPADATYGFGIGLGPQALGPVEDADPATYRMLADAGHAHSAQQRITHRGGEVSWRWGDWSTLSIARMTLLSILQRQAAEVGVQLRFETECTLDDVADADVVVAADGVNSVIRRALADRFAPRVELGHARFYWCGAAMTLPGPVFAFQESEHGAFTTHSYPYSGGMSGFMFETDVETLRRAGLADADDGLAPGESDLHTRAYLETLYAEILEGQPIATSNSRWTAFPVLTNATWRAGHVVLLGDAAHTAHPSIGSGTRMAMEDALALASSLLKHDDVDTAFADYEGERRPNVQSLQDAALASQRWWETFRRRLHLPLDVLGLHYVTRTGRYSARRMAKHDPALVREAERDFWSGYDRVGVSPLDAPLRTPTVDVATRVLTPQARADTPHRWTPVTDTDPESPSSDELVRLLRAEGAPGSVIRLAPHGDLAFHEPLPGLMLADRLRTELGRPVCVPADLSDETDREAAETGLLTRRIDLVEQRAS